MLVRFFGSLIVILVCLSFNQLSVLANYTTTLEQQVNLIDQEYLTTLETFDPTDNRLGLILWDPAKYTGESVYFEAIIACVSCSGGNDQAVAQLYTNSGSAVENAAVTTGNGTYSLVRTASAITGDLSSLGEYTVRLKRDASAGTAYLKAARLIIVQSATNLTDSQTQIELGNADTTTNTAYELLTGPKIYAYDTDVYSGVQNIFFEATLNSSSPTGTASAALSSSATCASTVSGSEVTVSGTTWSLARSANISSNLSDNTAYWLCLKSSSGDTASIASSKLVIDQSETNGLHKVQLIHLMANTQITDTDDSYSNTSFPLNFDPTNFGADVKEYYFETTFSTSGGEAYARLFNTSDSTSVTNSELTTSSTAYIRSRSGDLYWYLPTVTKDLDTQLRNSSTNTTYAATTALIIQLTRILDPALTFSISGVGANTVNNGITTSVSTQYHTLDFGHLSPLTPKYAAHALYVSANAVSGYTVSLKLLSYLQGMYPANNIDPFTSTWANPTAWAQPSGTTPNDNTGWFGANTTDTRVVGWSDGTQKFGPVTNSSQTVMQSTQPDSGTTTYVTYALEVNLLQPADQYSGSLVYNLIPTY